MSENQPHPISGGTSTETQEKYLLHSPLAIRNVLQDLSKRPELISAYFDGGKGHVLTTLITILPDRNLLVMEPGPDPEMNQRLLQDGKATCLAKHHDISVRFHLESITQARYQGEQVLAAPIPTSLFRLQRREYYRVHTPILTPLLCRMKLPSGEPLELPLSDISIGGLALLDTSLAFEADVGQVFEDCTLCIPDEASYRLDLRVRNILLIGEERHNPQLKVGCAFEHPDAEMENFIRRYVNRLQIQQKNLDRP